MYVTIISVLNNNNDKNVRNVTFNDNGVTYNNDMLNNNGVTPSNVIISTSHKNGNVNQDRYANNGINSENLTNNIYVILNGKTSKSDKTGAAVNSEASVPDGGWGWVITFTAFMAGFIIDGISFSFGLFFPHLMDHFGSSRSATSLIISVLNGTYLGIGLVNFQFDRQNKFHRIKLQYRSKDMN